MQLSRHAKPCKAVTICIGEALGNYDRGYFRIFTSVVGICIIDAWKAYRFHLKRRHRHKDMEMKDFVSALAHDMLHNNFDSLTYEDRVIVLIIDSGRGEMQSMMSSLGGGHR